MVAMGRYYMSHDPFDIRRPGSAGGAPHSKVSGRTAVCRYA